MMHAALSRPIAIIPDEIPGVASESQLRRRERDAKRRRRKRDGGLSAEDKAMLHRQSILLVLSQGTPMTAEQMARRWGLKNYAATRRHVLALEYAGKVTRLPGGYYTLPEGSIDA
jgi:predicted Rossmann fold nucleotide-binding protein DprA/Smf involved in DNA uptake